VKTVALVTYRELPDLTDDDRLVLDELRRQGIGACAVIWDAQDAQWERFDGVILRSCWDYHFRHDEFSDWISALEQNGVRLWNPASILRWNMNKEYLQTLRGQGIVIAPTVWLTKGSTVNLEEILTEQNWTQAVVKPTVSATAFQTWITSPEKAPADEIAVRKLLQRSGVMVQKFVEEVYTAGEWSFIFFLKRYSHAVLKRAREGDFRVQDEFGGSFERTVPAASLVEQAQRIVDTIDGPLLYARVDGIAIDDRFVLMELELVEPALYLGSDPHASQRFAQAILEVI